jgi:hypothetical protein
MPVTGPDFISLQARDLGASQAFYEQYLHLRRPRRLPHHPQRPCLRRARWYSGLRVLSAATF